MTFAPEYVICEQWPTTAATQTPHWGSQGEEKGERRIIWGWVTAWSRTCSCPSLPDFSPSHGLSCWPVFYFSPSPCSLVPAGWLSCLVLGTHTVFVLPGLPVPSAPPLLPAPSLHTAVSGIWGYFLQLSLWSSEPGVPCEGVSMHYVCTIWPLVHLQSVLSVNFVPASLAAFLPQDLCTCCSLCLGHCLLAPHACLVLSHLLSLNSSATHADTSSLTTLSPPSHILSHYSVLGLSDILKKW